MKKVTGSVDVSVYVDCPECGKTLDLMEIDYDENIVGKNLFGSRTEPARWDDIGAELYCPYCAAEFELNKFEY